MYKLFVALDCRRQILLVQADNGNPGALNMHGPR